MSKENPFGVNPNIGQAGDLFTWTCSVSAHPGTVSEFSVASGATRQVELEEVGYANGKIYLAKAGAGLTDTAFVCVSAAVGGTSVVAVINGTAYVLAP